MKIKKTNITLFANVVARTFSDTTKYRELKVEKSGGYWTLREKDAYTGICFDEVLLGISNKYLLNEFIIVRNTCRGYKTLYTAKTLAEALTFVTNTVFKKRYHLTVEDLATLG